ncbi:hypothetical protein [Cognatiyoonia sediminum]|uniref:hypothetical protein n=1 Tax=Cognatiyoonia sediminum TaxID=1508389 RepID=UPI0013F4D4E8|nr:hypothetical protein [Cognatiyoonia sediminum]
MSDTTADTWHFPEKTKESVELPAPVPFSTPVLITDCVTPLAGETVLSLILKRLDNQP